MGDNKYIDEFYDNVITKDKNYNIDRETFKKLILSYENYTFQKENYDRIEYICENSHV